MISENIAKRASKSQKLSLQSYPEFVGTGVVSKGNGSADLVVAVYVSSDPSRLSDSFRRAVPKCINVNNFGKIYSVPIKIIDIGKLAVG